MSEKPQSIKNGPKAKTSLSYRRRATVQLGRVSGRLLDKSIRRQGFVETRIVQDWPHIAGPELAQVTLPLSLKFARGKRTGATLYLRCSAAFAPLAQHQAPRIREAVNRYFGYPAVDKISISQGPIKHKRRGRGASVAPTEQDKIAARKAVEGLTVGPQQQDKTGLRSALVSLKASMAAKTRLKSAKTPTQNTSDKKG